MLSGYADVHVPFPIVQGLRMRGMDVATAQKRGQQRADDDVLLSQALREQRVMLTCDHGRRVENWPNDANQKRFDCLSDEGS